MKLVTIALVALSALVVSAGAGGEPGGVRGLQTFAKSTKDAKAKTKQAKSTKLFKSKTSKTYAGAGGGASITEEQIEAAQAAWGEGIVKIASTYTEGGDYVQAATDHINTLYAYGLTPILFKPTLAAENQFRSTFDGALSYFVATGHDAEDSGFAIKGWTDVRFENDDIITHGDVGMAMGNYFFTDPDGVEAKVEYSFGYLLDDEGKVRIHLHHSSLPYDPPQTDPKAITEEQIEAAQAAWGEGIVKIASAYTAGEDYTAVATDHINTLYAYGLTPILFKPTLAAENQFRSTFDGALSYFVATGHDAEDTGFAIKGWTDVRFENENIITEGPVGEAMGNYFFTTPEGDEVKVEYSFGYILTDEGDVKINLHHSSLPYDPAASKTITKEQIEAAQAAWGEGIVKIASAYTADENYTAVATDHINTLYAYQMPPILFKPTLAAEEQFRPTFDGALSYFVATGHITEDSGFAIKGWTDVRFENNGIITQGDVGMAMGNYFFTDPDGEESKVEYSFGYLLDDKDEVRIHLHHSSLPYDPTE